ncbi:ComEC/Rec2 family competence protein [Pseudanabaena mucicola]|uniref:ComEC/Rec2 family competence protein n=1 Tax=Pseudanabaena mucicola FACHB-723 TaxID=2692860 RepID=A0ABR7ZU46_9CYAN|nr:ComEC/Rec2 family competence protein [Pseudanabaena mucicola]MBD2186995.1 ComEC/Rec2 family competence protein [Pseudanabaena mucicola FACHB-723]
MKSQVALVLALSFVAGAYASFLSDWTGFYAVFGIGFGISLLVPAMWRLGPKRWVYLAATLIAIFACFYVKVRTPQPQAEDVSKYAPLSNVIVRGKVIETPSLTRSDRAKFLLEVQEINPSGKANDEPPKPVTPEPEDEKDDAEVRQKKAEMLRQMQEERLKTLNEQKFIATSGKLYVTVPLIESTGLKSGQLLELSGRLYVPSRADNFGAFDFKNYLARQGVFAGLSGRSLLLQGDSPSFGEWWFVSRIVRAHVTGAGVPEGALLSSLVLGSRAVDLPSDLKDVFIQAGLAAVLAASGFQVTLVLGAAIAITRTSSLKSQFMIGCLCLGAYLLLTGASPSILRAVVMGFGSLIGLVVQRRSRPVVGLIVTAVLLLLYQPLWIWDLGFQFSFLATFGLITTSRSIMERLEWLPPAIAELLSVPIAAYIWTLPLQLLVFGKLSPYSLLANMITTPLVSISTYGGIISGFLGVLFVPLGAAIAWFLYPLLHWTIGLAQWITSLPNANTSVGAITIWQMLVAYMLFIAIWLVPWFKKMQRWTIAFALACGVMFVPNAIAQANTFQIILPSFNDVPIMLIKNQGQTVLINSGNRQFASFTLQPLIQKLGINRLDWAISTDTQPDFSDGWNVLATGSTKIGQFRDMNIGVTPKTYQSLQQALTSANTPIVSTKLGETITINNQISLQLLNQSPDVLKIKTGELSWLLIANTDQKSQSKISEQVELLPQLSSNVLWWTGGQLEPTLLQAINPRIAIASSTSLSEAMVNQLYENKTKVLWTGRDGSIQWNPDQDFQTLRDQQDAQSPI